MQSPVLLVRGSRDPHEARGVMQRAGYEVLEVRPSGVAAALARRNGIPLVVVVDATAVAEEVPRLVRRLRHRPRTRGVPVILLTAGSSAELEGGLEGIALVSLLPERSSPFRLLQEVQRLTIRPRENAPPAPERGSARRPARPAAAVAWNDPRMDRTWSGAAF
jgi:CheY-like chemotaxis protein